MAARAVTTLSNRSWAARLTTAVRDRRASGMTARVALNNIAWLEAHQRNVYGNPESTAEERAEVRTALANAHAEWGVVHETLKQATLEEERAIREQQQPPR
jgi:hypothetical protein